MFLITFAWYLLRAGRPIDIISPMLQKVDKHEKKHGMQFSSLDQVGMPKITLVHHQVHITLHVLNKEALASLLFAQINVGYA
jgi:Cu/Ag efflux protein CusF